MSDTHFNIKIAGKVIEVFSLYDAVHEYCADYITEESAHFTLRTSEEDITYERRREEKGNSVGRIPEDYPDSYLEILALYRKIAEEMIKYDTILMHGSALSIDGNGVLFVAASGTGKSTHASIWQRVFNDRVVLLNDDKPLVKFEGDDIFVYGTPWSGKKGLNKNARAALKMIYKIERAACDDQKESAGDEVVPTLHKGNNAVYDMSADAVWNVLCSQSYRSGDPVHLAHSIELLDRLRCKVPVKGLVCDMSDEAAVAAYQGLLESIL